LLRRADIARRRRVLEVGAGWGLVSRELQQRSGGNVVALDCLPPAPPPPGKEISGVEQIVGRAEALPLADGSFELVFMQFTLLWLAAPQRAIAEACRVLAPRGVLAAIEPDYGGLMEHPPELALREVWLAALSRAGADPCVGRKLPRWFAEAGLSVETLLLDRVEPADDLRFNLLEELPLAPEERERLAAVRARCSHRSHPPVVHLPFWLVLGRK
jgi:SAM-dependent methyltransferase